jgi:serine protease Do
MRTPIVMVGFSLLMAASGWAQDRDAKVRGDREAFRDSSAWIYNDLDRGIRAAKEAGKPLLVVFRCIPCEACHEFDDEVAQRDPIIRDLLDEFTCVRIVQANVIDLSRFHFDFDQSFAIILMNPDGTIYGRFGTRSARPEWDDISLHGLRKAMAEALRMHRDYDRVKPSLAGKQVKPSRYRTPLDYPSLSARYREKLDYEGQVARSCIHCHQIRDAERRVYRSAGEPMPDEVLYPYPDPEVLGLSMDPKEMATVARIAPGSIADRAGLRPHDAVASLAGQPLLSIADLQWVLHNAPATARLKAEVLRDGGTKELTLDLPDGWRRGDISWRTTSWELRRMALGGMRLDDLADDQREGAGLPKDGMALRVRHVGEFGDHAVAKKAGFRKGDLIVAFDGQERRMTESDLFAYALQRKRPGDAVDVTVLRDGERTTLRLTFQ